MYQLTYQSTAMSHISEEDIKAILESARNRNNILEVTGCLVFHNFRFVQIIEGKKKQIKTLFADIERDKRHFDVELLWEGNIQERGFSDWNMAYYKPAEKKVNESDLRNFERNLLLLSELSESTTATLGMFWVGVQKLLVENAH
ncbi:hypothetical protein KCTC52924_00472 [Arenibacter antarcticus]|uniref:BLUF domain-containing protein n=1 Tax=Arenibacter antarcticus TaxID=2040469 RepID=A0ABW5VFG3_9FLAO|nr:BLUF domain-containing protein [Arenibacter sp. H213]MCM4169437.1 hypothetical protein [Arenibacter sp. H213]